MRHSLKKINLHGKRHAEVMACQMSLDAPETDTLPVTNANCALLQPDLHDVFFGTENIEHTLRLLLETQISKDHDLTKLLGLMCTGCVQYVFTDHGFTPYAEMPLVIVSYAKMTQPQLKAIDRVLDEATRDLTNFKVSSLMGGGSSIHLLSMRRSIVSRVDLLVALHKIIKSSVSSQSSAGVDISTTFNLILQRLVCSIGLPREQIVQIRDRIHENKQ